MRCRLLTLAAAASTFLCLAFVLLCLIARPRELAFGRYTFRSGGNLLVITASVLPGPPNYGTGQTVQALMRRTNNREIHWDLVHSRLHPYAEYGTAADGLRLHPGWAVPALLSALDDPDRFVVAHVVLTGMGVPGATDRKLFNATTFNGLSVTRSADGAPQIDPSQLPAIRRAWHMRNLTHRQQIAWLSIPWIVATLALLPLAWLAATARQYQLAARRTRRGLCPTCCYNLTANTTGTCPECGISTVSRTITPKTPAI